MICLDASVAVKWFKKGEEFESEALELYKNIKDFRVEAVANEWIILEVVRALVKACYEKEKIENSFDVLNDLFSLNVLKKIPVSITISIVKKIMIETNLYTADAVHLATAIITSSEFLVTQDKHLLKDSVKKFSERYGVNVVNLKEFRQF